jgi:hypothetical protein
MSCRKASTVSVITVGSRAKPASRISHAFANCLQCHSSRSMPSRLSTPNPKSQKRQSIPVPAAAAICASSRPSCAGNSRSTAPRRFRQRSGSTPHDADASPRHTRQHSPPVLALARPRRRSPRHAGSWRNHNQKTHNLVTQNARCSIVPQPTFRLRGKTGLAAASRHHRRTEARGQIPIPPAALLPPTSRDFVPWRFSDAGHWSPWIVPPSRHPKTCTNAEVIRYSRVFCGRQPRSATFIGLCGVSTPTSWTFEWSCRRVSYRVIRQLVLGSPTSIWRRRNR